MYAALSRGLRAALAAAVLALALAPASARAHLHNIEIETHDTHLSILISLSEQPTGASAQISDDGLTVSINGVALEGFTAAPPTGRAVTDLEGGPDGRGGALLSLKTPPLSSVSTTLYRRAVLIDAALKSSSTPSTPDRSMKSNPPAPKPKQIVGAPNAAAPPNLLAAAGLSQADCKSAYAAIEDDPWNLAKLGDSGICRAAEGDDAASRVELEQLAAFSPDDWRAPYGLAEIARREGDAPAALNRYDLAMALAEAPSIKEAISQRRDAYFP
ncbi:MAG: hypothetical protein AAF719_02480, partial [Pseudomonadota bacterium]